MATKSQERNFNLSLRSWGKSLARIRTVYLPLFREEGINSIGRVGASADRIQDKNGDNERKREDAEDYEREN